MSFVKEKRKVDDRNKFIVKALQGVWLRGLLCDVVHFSHYVVSRGEYRILQQTDLEIYLDTVSPQRLDSLLLACS